MGATFIQAGSYDLNSLLANEAINNIHSIYLVFVDVILWLGLLVLSANTFVDIFGGKYMDDVFETGYEAYNRYSINKKSKDRTERGVGFSSNNSVIRRK